jgi:MFS family permease
MGVLPKLSAPIKILLLNNFGFNIGFYMLLPYLTRHITENLGFTAGFAGFIMGFRMFSQQGLFLIGGTLADRFNYQSVIMIGCGLRVVGFALFGVVSSSVGVVCAAFMTGFAGALFNPAYQALLARLTAGHPEREKIYALQNVTSQSGVFLGPLAGMLLLRYGFAFLGFASATIFFLLFLLQWRYLPSLAGSDHASKRPVWDDWLSVLRQRDFVVFCFLMSAYFVMFNQIYIVLPLSVPDNKAVTAIFTLTAILSIVLQIPVNHAATALFPRPFRLGLGMALMAFSFPILTADLGTAGGIPVAPFVTTAVLSVGMLVIFPTALSMVPELGRERHQGICFGVFYFFAGMAGASGGGLSAWLWDLNQNLLLFSLAGIGVLFALLLWLHTVHLKDQTLRA